MPNRHGDDRARDGVMCRRCQDEEAKITVRTEPQCIACFGKYVTTKVVKRMETFRVRHSEPGEARVLLLPLSFGTCSMLLLHIVSQHLKGQTEKTGRTGFKLHVLHVRTAGSDQNAEDFLEEVRHLYPEHQYSISRLSDVFAIKETADRLGALGVDIRLAGSNEEQLQHLLIDSPSPTSRQDMSQILLHLLIIHQAKRSTCEAVLWANSTTSLAERILAETAKGRGASLPWYVTDGESPIGLPCCYPLRDVLRKEAASYMTLLDPPIRHLVVGDDDTTPVSTRNTTIDKLMKRYFESVEQEYPSIVSNVVRTSTKLHAPPLSLVEQQCELCDMPLNGDGPERSRLCYGCIRSLARPVE